MILSRIEALGFRNLKGSVTFGPGLNILYGNNAQGKTNWLEAVYVLGNTKSFRTNQLRDVLAFESSECIIRGELRRGGIEKQVQMRISASSKELFVNGKRETMVRYLSNLDVFAFSLEELEVIRGQPERRRRFLDAGIVNLTPSLLSTFSQYNQVIKQKNRLLSEARDSDNPQRYYCQIETWNDQLITLGTEIHLARSDYVDKLNNVLAQADDRRGVFGAEEITVRYLSCLEGKGDLDHYTELFSERLGLRLQAELAAGHSLIGPHRDDLEISADGRDVARFGSAGQQRSALIILDLAQISIYNSVYDESPVLLIDDIDAELDRGRIEALLSELEGRTQTLVSTSRRAIADRYRDRACVCLVEEGRAIEEENGRFETSK